MATKLTLAQIRFFFNASLPAPSGEPQPTLLAKLLAFSLPVDFRYRLEVLTRQLISAAKPGEAEMKDLFEAHQATLAGIEADDEESKAAAKTDAEVKLRADMDEIDKRPIEFTGHLILATQLEKLSDEVAEFLSIPGVLGEWLFPFIEDNLTAKKV